MVAVVFPSMKDNNKTENSTNNDKYVLVSFQSSHHAIRGEKEAGVVATNANCKVDEKTNNKLVRLIPLPPEISAGCGLVLQLPFSLLQSTLDTFKSEAIAFEDVFIVECGEKKTYTQLPLE